MIICCRCKKEFGGFVGSLLARDFDLAFNTDPATYQKPRVICGRCMSYLVLVCSPEEAEQDINQALQESSP